MEAVARVRAVPGPNHVAYEVLRSDPPLLLRPCGSELQLVGGAAGPLGGDRLAYEIDVATGVDLRIRTVAASVVLAGAEPSSATIEAEVAAGAHLDWAAEPLVSTIRSDHRQAVSVRLEGDATLRWREDIVWGRSAEPGGRLVASLRIERDGRAVLHQDLFMGDPTSRWDGPGGLAGARVVATEVLVGDDLVVSDEAIVDEDGSAVASRLAPDVWLLQSIGLSHRRTAERLERLRPEAI